MDFFIITSLTKDISRIDLIGILFGHLIFGVALTQLLDWTWLRNLMSEKDKVLTKAIIYNTLEELLLTSVIYSDSCRRNLLFE